MRFLLSSLILVVAGCTSYPKKMGYSKLTAHPRTIINPYFSDTTQDYVYKASIDAFSNHFGGILVIKKMVYQEHRVVFTTEMGNTIFDFTFNGGDLKVNKIIDQLDKPLIINILKKDFGALVKEEIAAEERYEREDKEMAKARIGKKSYFYTFGNSRLVSISRIGNQKEKVVFEFSEINGDLADQIKIIHINIDLTIELTAI